VNKNTKNGATSSPAKGPEEKHRKRGRKTSHRGIKDLGNGEFAIRLYVDGRDTMRKIKANGSREAAKIRLGLIEQMKQNERSDAKAIDAKQCMLFGDVADEWFREITTRRHAEDPMQLHLLETTRKRYEGSIRDFLKPCFGQRLARAISEEDVTAWRRPLLEVGYGRATINGHHRVLRQILRAIGNEAAACVPELNEKVGARITRKEPNLLNAAEFDRFLEVARDHWPQWYAMILVLFTTTVRLGAARALRREDIDLETMELIVARRFSGEEIVPGVKRDRFGEDAPPCLPEVLDALKQHWATFNEAQWKSGLMFPAKDGHPFDRGCLRKAFVDIRHRAGITKRFTPHGCRRTGEKWYGRTSGTRMAMEIAGHRTLRMHEHYTPVLAEEKQAAARGAFGQLRVISGAAPTPATADRKETGIDPGLGRNKRLTGKR
jgi:integrase